jgi:predicted metal-dependent peptidase
MALTPQQVLSAAFLAAERKRPYFATGLAAIVRRFGPLAITDGSGKAHPTMGITRGNVLVINPDFIAKHDAPVVGEILVHEMLHVLRRHADRADMIPNVNRMAWNIAADMEINDDLDGNLLPGDGAFPEKAGFTKGLLAEEYYTLLMQSQKQKKGGGGDGDGDGEEEDGQGAGAGKGKGKGGKLTNGRCGSGSGGEPVDGEGDGAAGAKERPHGDMERIRRDVAEAIQQAAQEGRGDVPAGLLRQAELELKPAKVRWEQRLRRAIRCNVASAAGRVDYTRVRPNRRQGAFDALAKALRRRAPLLPAMYAPQPLVAFGVDTSGSMGTDELQRALSEADSVLKTLRSPVVFLACDCACAEPIVVKSAVELARNMRGGGGTDFNPIFEAVSELRPRPSVFIFVTDGAVQRPT